MLRRCLFTSNRCDTRFLSTVSAALGKNPANSKMLLPFYENYVLKHLPDEKTYKTLCENLKTNNLINVNPVAMACVPLASLLYRDTTSFANDLLLKWWSEFEKKVLKPINHNNTTKARIHVKQSDLSMTLFALQRLNFYSNDRVQKTLGWQRLSALSEKILTDAHKSLNIKRYIELLDVFMFFDYIKMSPAELSEMRKTNLKHQLFSSFVAYIGAMSAGGVKGSSPEICAAFIGRLMDRAVRLDMDTPPESCLAQITQVAALNFRRGTVRNTSEVFTFLHNLHSVANGFLRWNRYNPGDEFWSKFYEEVFDRFEAIDEIKDSLSCAMMLRTYLLVMLTYDRQQDFASIADIWISNMQELRKHLSKSQVDEMLRLMFQKYPNGADPTGIIDVNRIVTVLK